MSAECRNLLRRSYVFIRLRGMEPGFAAAPQPQAALAPFSIVLIKGRNS
jgi:hypothetical protein